MIEKYLVAATACYTDPSQQRISLRFTTQMPSIRGFGPLMALIFCPTMQVKCNNTNTCYTAIRTGLGYDSTKKRPVFQEHDMVFNLNVEISHHDIELVRVDFIIFLWPELMKCVFFLQVNQIRYCLDTLLLTYPGEELSTGLRKNTKRELQHSIKSQIIK